MAPLEWANGNLTEWIPIGTVLWTSHATAAFGKSLGLLCRVDRLSHDTAEFEVVSNSIEVSRVEFIAGD